MSGVVILNNTTSGTTSSTSTSSTTIQSSAPENANISVESNSPNVNIETEKTKNSIEKTNKVVEGKNEDASTTTTIIGIIILSIISFILLIGLGIYVKNKIYGGSINYNWRSFIHS